MMWKKTRGPILSGRRDLSPRSTQPGAPSSGSSPATRPHGQKRPSPARGCSVAPGRRPRMEEQARPRSLPVCLSCLHAKSARRPGQGPSTWPAPHPVEPGPAPPWEDPQARTLWGTSGGPTTPSRGFHPEMLIKVEKDTEVPWVCERSGCGEGGGHTGTHV